VVARLGDDRGQERPACRVDVLPVFFLPALCS
jgi:hypothetical protein